MRLFEHVVCMGEKRNVYRIMVGKPDKKRQYEKPRIRWVNTHNNEMDLKKIRYGVMDWTELAQDRDRWRAISKAVMNLLVP